MKKNCLIRLATASNSLDQDDLYVDMTFAKLWDANLAARRALKLEIWNNYSSPPERISISDMRWKFHGEWTKLDRYSVASREDVEATVSFYDTGAILTGTSSKGSKIRIQDIVVVR